MISQFWLKASKCEHRNIYPEYGVLICSVCDGHEYHCKDCNVYFSDCRCGNNAGMSGWSSKRYKNWHNGRLLMRRQKIIGKLFHRSEK